MKKMSKKLGQNKFQFFFFVGILSFVLIALVIAAATPVTDDTPNDDDVINDNNQNDDVVDSTPTITDVEEEFIIPLSNELEYLVTRKFYEKDASTTDQEKALIKYGTTFRTSDGTSYALVNNENFDVVACFSGKVIDVKEHPLYSNYVVIEHDNDIKTYYYGLSEVVVSVGMEVEQNMKIGVSGTTELDSEAGNHVYLKVEKNGKKLNPEKLTGKKISEI
ncbi:MAG: M23 family metallopeptidase [Bacilli bacterium]|nr:M23 family metallopeptidase [Bacilli bacterium]